MLPTKFRFIWPSGFRGEVKKTANQKQGLPVAAMFINESGQNVQSLEGE
jgi:peptidyl-tRNA hydrolase